MRIITDLCRAFALSGRNLCVGLLSQGVAPCSRLPWAGRYCPFRARNNSALLYLLVVDIVECSEWLARAEQVLSVNSAYSA